MKKLRVVVFMHEDLVPPEKLNGVPKESAPWRTEYDVVSTLRKMGHEVRPVGIRSDLSVIRQAIEDFKPHAAFNLLEEFDGVAVYDQNVVSFLELLRVPYTGCNPRGLMLARDKALCKKILHYHRIPTPEFAVYPMGRIIKRSKRLQFPLIVKSLIEEASLGIAQASVVYDEAELNERVRFVHDKLKTDALVEEYIDGRELYVAMMGNSRRKVFAIWELFFEKLGEKNERIATAKVKWDLKYQKKFGISSGEAKVLAPDKEKEIVRMCKRAYDVLGLNGYARIDLRMNEKEEIFIIEVNPNPQIAEGEDFAESARKAGMSYAELLQRILNLGIRWSQNRSG
ncbi:MAG: ATP-grasp domain-containing protein [Deltaproteobacteria bacterium]|nr:ATP-grasp domain-containing protein [Deltaproteobacteria bacterium]